MPQGSLVRVGRYADGELLAELLGQLYPEPVRCLVVHAGGRIDEAEGLPEVVVRKALHPDKDAARSVLRLPTVHERG